MPGPLKQPDKSLFLWAILPPEELAERIDAWRRECAERFSASRALRLPVHLTLYPPFHADESEMLKQFSGIDALCSQHNAFSIALKNFGFFEKKNPVAFIDVVLNLALEAFQRELQHLMNDFLQTTGDDRKYHPHFTLAYRDLASDKMKEVKEFFAEKEFSAVFVADQICLLRNEGHGWMPYSFQTLGS